MFLSDKHLFGLRAPADEGAAGGAAAAASPTPAAKPDAAAVAAAAGAASGAAAATAPDKAAEPPKATSILDKAVVPEDKGDKKPEDKPAETDEQKAAREKAETEAKEKASADLLKAYDGLKTPKEFDTKAAAFQSFKESAAKAGITAETAQALLDSVAPKLVEQISAPYEQWAKTQKEWIDAINSEYPGEKQKTALGHIANIFNHRLDNNPFVQSEAEANELRQVFAITGAGNNPAIFRLLERIGELLSEGSPASGKPAPQEKSAAEVLYPSMAKAT